MKTIQVFISAIFLIVALSSCKVYPPVYKRVENFGVHQVDRDGFKLTGNIVFFNPNKFKFKLHEILMDVQIDGKHVATAGQLQPVPINRNSEFSVPLDLTIKPDMTVGEGLKTLLNIFKTKLVNVTIEGTVVVKAMGAKIPIAIKENEKIDITKLR
jgi:LEA14-like dessication related protein